MTVSEGLSGEHPARCVDRGDRHTACAGDVEYRESMSGTGRAVARCDRHWGMRLAVQAEIVRRYDPFGSGGPPASFDPAYAGESWDDE